MIPAHRTEVVLDQDGRLLIEHLPFLAGQRVEVIVLPSNEQQAADFPLRGSVVRYDRPTEPVADLDWNALQ
jgi:hypothetical protein